MRGKFTEGTFTNERMLSSKTLYKAAGFSDDDFERPVIGIADSFSDIVPGHKTMREISQQVKYGIYRAGGTPVEFGVIGVCDGICTTHSGARYSLPSRDITADSIEVMARAHRMDGLVLAGACDKTVPGMLMAAARLDIPCIFIAGGCMLGGTPFGEKKKSDSTSVTEAYGMYQNGDISFDILRTLALKSCPTTGSCQHMATANTMCNTAEAMGLSLPGSAAIPAVYNERARAALRTGEAIVGLVHKGITARDILTPAAIKNAIKALLAVGGSTNAVIHICAIANEIGMDAAQVMRLFEEYGETIPLIARVNPSSYEYDALDFYMAGGMPEVMRQIAGLLDLECFTVTGKTVKENLEEFMPLYEPDPDIITSLDKPFSTLPGLVIMRGNLAPETAVAKPAAIAQEVYRFRGKAVCFDSEEACTEAITKHMVKPGHVVVIRYVGPKGGPGMPEMFKPLKLLYGQGLNKTTALITDGRFSGTNNGCFVGHISPEAAAGGPLAAVMDGDEIYIDVIEKKIELLVTEEEIEKRLRNFKYASPEFDGYLKRYARNVRSANGGAVVE